MSYNIYYSVLYSGGDTPDTVNLPNSYLFTPAEYPPAQITEISWNDPLQSMKATFSNSVAQAHFRISFGTRYWSEDTYGVVYYTLTPLLGYWYLEFEWGNSDGPAATLMYTFDTTAYPWYIYNTEHFSNNNDYRDANFYGAGSAAYRVEGEQTLWEQFSYMRFFGPALTIPIIPPGLGEILPGKGSSSRGGTSSIWQA